MSGKDEKPWPEIGLKVFDTPFDSAVYPYRGLGPPTIPMRTLDTYKDIYYGGSLEDPRRPMALPPEYKPSDQPWYVIYKGGQEPKP